MDQEHSTLASGRSASGSTFSVLGGDTSIKGDITATADLHVDGKVEGDIVCATLVQGESGEVIGGVRAECARLAGLVRGSVSARDLVVLKTARLHGDVQYDTLTIEQGALVDGHLSPRAEQAKDDKAAGNAEARLILASANEKA
ncbi:MAG: polymer-forming cytoskeletal protein [Novosphingobium sp.]|nr:polymer-forming cytoskeletal protein [Novosphingobium sp.]